MVAFECTSDIYIVCASLCVSLCYQELLGPYHKHSCWAMPRPLPTSSGLSEIALHLPLGYQLCDNSVGVLFNDSTRLILYNDGDSLQYIERDGTESYLTVSSHPNSLMKKVSTGC